MRKRLLTLSLANPKQKAEAVFKPVYYGDIRLITNSFRKNVLKQRLPSLGCELRFGLIFSSY
jgi:hypothetical protein